MSVKNKLTYLNDTKSLIRNKLKKFGIEISDNDTFRSYANKLDKILELYPKVSGEGTDVTLNNTIKAPFTKFDIEGHSEQETTEGKNKLNLNGVSGTNNNVAYRVNENGKLVLNGSCLSDRVTIPLPATAIDGTYTFSSNYQKSIAIKNSNNDNIVLIDTTQANYKTFTSTDTIGSMVIYGLTGVTFSNEEIELQIEEGSTKTSWEKFTYGASPNPSYEQPIKSAGEETNVFNKELFEEFTSEIKTLEIQLEPNTAYTMSSNIPYSTSNLACLFFKLPSQSYGTGTNGVKEGQPRTLTTDSTGIVNVGYRRTGIEEDNPKENYWYQINKGSIVKPYVPYGMRGITEKIVNGNLAKYPYSTSTITTRGITFTDKGDGIISANGTATQTAYFNFYSNNSEGRLKLKAGTYTLSLENTPILNSGVLGAIKDSSGNTISGAPTILLDHTHNPETITINQDFEIAVYATVNSGVSLNNFEFKLQIERNSQKTEWKPYQFQTKTYYTQQPFRSIGDVRDVFFKNTVDSPYYDENLILNGWYERHDIKELIVDGTNVKVGYIFQNGYSILRDKNNNIIFEAQEPKNNQTVANILCNKLKAISQYNMESNSKMGICVHMKGSFTGGYIQIKLDNSTDNSENNWTVESMNTYLAGNTLTVNFQPQEPTNLLCTQEQIDILENIPSTFSGQTNVFSIDEVKAYLKIQYWESDTNG